MTGSVLRESIKWTNKISRVACVGGGVTDDFSVALCYRLVMSQPVKLSDTLVLDARLAGEVMQRSIAGQVEFWARLGRSVETLLEGRQVLDLCRNGGTRPISACLESVDTPLGRQRVAARLEDGPFPHYEQHPARPGLLVRIEENGLRTAGRFINRQFHPVKSKSKQ